MSSSLVQYPFKSARLAAGCTPAYVSFHATHVGASLSCGVRLPEKIKPLKSAPWSKPSFVVRARHRLKRSSCFRRQRLHYEPTKINCQLTLRQRNTRPFYCRNRIVRPQFLYRFGDDLLALCLRVFRLGRHEKALCGADEKNRDPNHDSLR